MEIEEIKYLWKEQKAKDTEIKASGHYSSLVDDLKKNEAKVKRNYMLTTLILILTIVFINKAAVEKIIDKTLLTWTGFGLIYLAILAILIVSWATVIKFKINNVTESSLVFLKSAREKLRLRNRIRTTGVPVYLGLLTVGITLTYIQITEPLGFYYKLLTFFLLYSFIITVSIISMSKEKKKYLNYVKPIEDKIDTLLKEQ